jgi:DNA-binding NarL/FixJ family response regulator
MTGGAPVRIVIADDQALVRAGLATLLDSQPGLTVVGQAGTGEEAVHLSRKLRPDVVLMDIRMPVLNGLAATRRILADAATATPATATPATATPASAAGTADAGVAAGGGQPVRVVVLTTYDLDEYVYEALRAGASGFLLKHAPPEELLLGVRAAADGGALLSPQVTRRLVAEFAARRPAARRPPPELDRLTPREREVLDLVIGGRSNTEIADALTVSQSTVKTHLGHILDKLGLRDRVQAVVFGYEHGLVEPGNG